MDNMLHRPGLLLAAQVVGLVEDTTLCFAVQELACSLRKSNPELQLLVLSATQDRLSESVRRRAKLLARVHQVDDIDFDLNLRSVYKEDGRQVQG